MIRTKRHEVAKRHDDVYIHLDLGGFGCSACGQGAPCSWQIEHTPACRHKEVEDWQHRGDFLIPRQKVGPLLPAWLLKAGAWSPSGFVFVLDATTEDPYRPGEPYVRSVDYLAPARKVDETPEGLPLVRMGP